MQYEYEKSFFKQRDKLIKKRVVSLDQVNNTIDLFKENKNDDKLYYHNINCKKDKNRKSIAVLETGQTYKILFSEYDDLVNFIFIGHHDKYDRQNKNC